MTKILSIDPGPSHSAYAVLDGKRIVEHAWLPNEELRVKVSAAMLGNVLLIEAPQPQNRPLGRLMLDTIKWYGMFVERIRSARDRLPVEVDERDVAIELCGSRSATNSQLYQALKDHFGETTEQPCECGSGLVEGKRPGTSKKCPRCKGERFVRVPGPLAWLNEHERSCVAMCLWWQRRNER